MLQELHDDRIELTAMLPEQPPGFLVALIGDPAHFLVHGVEETLRHAGHPRIAFGRQHRQRADALRHAPAADHRARDPRHHFEVAFGAGRDQIEHFLLGGHPAQRADDAPAQIVGIEAVAVGFRRGERDAEGAPARNDRHLAHRVGSRLEHAEQCMAGLVVCRAPALFLRDDDIARRTQLHLLQRVEQVALTDLDLHAAGGEQRRLVHEIGQVGARHPGRGGRDPLEIGLGGERHRAGVDLQDLHAPLVVRRVHDDLAIEAAGAEERRIQHVRPVGRREHDHALVSREPVHLGEDLIQGLLALVVPAHGAGAAARPPDGIDLVDEDDGRRDLARLREQLAHAARADADDHLDELGRARAEERHLGFAGCGAGEQRLARAGRAGEQHALGHARAEAAILLGLLEEVHDLVDLGLDLVDAGDVVEGHSHRLGIDALLPAAAEQAAHRTLLALEHPDVEADQQEHRRERDEQVREKSPLLHDWGGAHRRAAVRQLRQQVVVGERRPLGRELLIRASGLSRLRNGFLELALDGVAAGEHFGNILPADLHLEFGIGHRLRPRQLVLHRQHGEQHQIAGQAGGHDGPARPAFRRLAVRKALRAPRAGPAGRRCCRVRWRTLGSTRGGS